MNFTQKMSLGVGAAALVGAVFASETRAQEFQTEKLQVTAFVGDACTVTSAQLDFGEYDPDVGNDASGEIALECVTNIDLQVALDAGNNTGAFTNNLRTLSNNGGPAMFYALYSTESNTPWDHDQFVPFSAGSGINGIPVYGSISAGQSASQGAYSDEVGITLTFVSP